MPLSGLCHMAEKTRFFFDLISNEIHFLCISDVRLMLVFFFWVCLGDRTKCVLVIFNSNYYLAVNWVTKLCTCSGETLLLKASYKFEHIHFVRVFIIAKVAQDCNEFYWLRAANKVFALHINFCHLRNWEIV